MVRVGALVGAMCLLGVFGAGAAYAEDPDAEFLDDLRASGIGYSSAQEVVAMAYEVCDHLRSGASCPDIAEPAFPYADPANLEVELGVVLGVAIGHYCVDQLSAFADAAEQMLG